MITEKDFVFTLNTNAIEKGNFQWSAPSNIALVKYFMVKFQLNCFKLNMNINVIYMLPQRPYFLKAFKMF